MEIDNILIDEDWIDKRIKFINGQIGIYKTRGSDFFFEPTEKFYEETVSKGTEGLNEIMGKMAEHINTPTVPWIKPWGQQENPVVTIEDNKNNEDNGFAGVINYRSPYQSQVELNIKNKYSPLILGAVLAHELTHHFLFSKGINLEDIDENERVVDLTTIFLGLGKITLNGYETFVIGDKFYKIGYLSHRDMAMIFDKVCLLRGIPTEVAKRNLTKGSLREYNIVRQDRIKKEKRRKKLEKIKTIFPFGFGKKEERTEKDDSQKINNTKEPKGFSVIKCPRYSCKSNLRIPKNKGTLMVRCPICGHSFKTKTRYK